MTRVLSVEDRIAIQDVVSRYAWALDTGDVEGFVACFASDGELVWDTFERPEAWRGPEALRHFAAFLRDQPMSAGRQHHVTNLLIEPASEGARGKAYAAVALRQGDGPHLLHVMGWYEDLYRRENGEWRLARRIIRDWSGPVLSSFAGQSGERIARTLPPPLAGLRYNTGSG